MKLVIATPLYPPQPGGPATYAKLLEDGLGVHGDTVTVVKFGDVKRLPTGIRHIAYCRRVIAAGRKADLILALDPVSVGFPVLVASRILKKPYVVKIVGDYAWEQGRQCFGVQEELDDFVKRERLPFAVACFRHIQNMVAKGAVHVLVPSNYLRSIITQWGIAPGKISVIYNAIELPSDTAPIADTFVALSAPRVLTVARLVPWKGLHELITAVASVYQKDPTVSLTIVGSGPLQAKLRKEATEQLPECSWLSGGLPHEETLALMKAADIFVLNSSYEGLSHVLIEALMLGKAIIATRAGGNRELITDGENGLLVDVGDTIGLIAALERLVDDTELRARLAARAQTSARQFSVLIMLAKTHEMLAAHV